MASSSAWSTDRYWTTRAHFKSVNRREITVMSRKKISTTIYVTPEQSDKLKLLHDRTKVPVAVYIREGIDLVLRHYAHLLPGQLPLDVTPPPGVASAEETPRRAPKAKGSSASVERAARTEPDAADD